jgi:hypothetical protein
MRLSIKNRIRTATIYINKNLHFKHKRSQVLKQLAAEENIIASDKTMKRIVQRWQITGNLDNKTKN